MIIIKRVIVLVGAVGAGVVLGTLATNYLEVGGFMRPDDLQPYARPQSRPAQEPADGKVPTR